MDIIRRIIYRLAIRHLNVSALFVILALLDQSLVFVAIISNDYRGTESANSEESVAFRDTDNNLVEYLRCCRIDRFPGDVCMENLHLQAATLISFVLQICLGFCI